MATHIRRREFIVPLGEAAAFATLTTNAFDDSSLQRFEART